MRGAVVVLAGDLKEELPVLYLRLRRAVTENKVPLIELSSHVTGLTPYANVSLRYLPGEQATLAQTVTQQFNDANSSVGKLVEQREGNIVLILGRPSVAESEVFTVDAASELTQLANVRVLSALRRGNVHGAIDMGLAPGFLPGRVSVEHGDAFADWKVSKQRGLDTAGMLEACTTGVIETLILLGADVLSDFPDHDLAQRALKSVSHLVVIDTHESANIEHAEVVIPAAMWGEQYGTITNLEGRVQKIAPKVTSPGAAMPDWRIAQLIAEELKEPFHWTTGDDVTDEIARVAPAYASCDANLLDVARDGVVVPAHEHRDAIALGGRVDLGSLYSWEPIRPKATEQALEVPEISQPSQSLHQFSSTQSRTQVPNVTSNALRLTAVRKLYDDARSTQLNPNLQNLGKGEAFLSVNSADAAVVNRAQHVRVRSGKISIELPLTINNKIQPGNAVIVFNTPDALAAQLIHANEPLAIVEIEAA